MATTEREAKPKAPPPQPSSWHVVAGSRALTVTATYASISTNGVLVFKDADGQLIKAFHGNGWSSAEMFDDPFGNAVEPAR